MRAWDKNFIKNLEAKLGRKTRPGELAGALAALEAGEEFKPGPEVVYSDPDPWPAIYDPPVSVYLGFFGANDRSDYLKIGIAQNVHRRMTDLRYNSPMLCILALSFEFANRRAALAVEAALLRHMRADKTRGEWVNCKASVDACRTIAESLAEVASTVSRQPVVFAEA